MTETSAKISSTELLCLLAGRKDSESLLEAFARADPSKSPNPFAVALSRGLGITAITLERDDEFDDDWVVFHFGFDAAQSKIMSLLMRNSNVA